MCDDHIGLCPHTPGGDPHEPQMRPRHSPNQTRSPSTS